MAHNLTGLACSSSFVRTSPQGSPIGVCSEPWREEVAFAVVGAIQKQLGGWKPPKLRSLKGKSQGEFARLRQVSMVR